MLSFARMRIGVLTGGGDCPGLNAVIRGIVRKGINQSGHALVGFRHGWAGVLKNEAVELTNENTRGILHRGGTILGSSRTNPFKVDGGVEQVREAVAQRRLDALIPIGGEDTLGVARRLVDEGVPVVGVPKTIDNDLRGPTSRSASRPPSRSPPTRSIACTRRRSRTTA